MSGFITTMFVSHSPSFPAKPEPLLPILNFAQSQSCMNLRMDLEVPDFQTDVTRIDGITGDGWPGNQNQRSTSGSGLARPKETYQSPLQRIGEALRTQQAGADLAARTASAKPPPDPHLPSEPNESTDKSTNYSYKLLHGATTSTTNLTSRHDVALVSGRDTWRSVDTGSIIGPAARARAQTPRNKGYFAGTGLLSSLFSNPRTRAPFKPQKSGRGTSSWQLKQYAEATLGSGSLRKAVKLPEGEDKDEWLAVNGRYDAVSNEAYADMGGSRRLLQPDQPPLRLHHRVLLTAELPRNESHG